MLTFVNFRVVSNIADFSWGSSVKHLKNQLTAKSQSVGGVLHNSPTYHFIAVPFKWVKIGEIICCFTSLLVIRKLWISTKKSWAWPLPSNVRKCIENIFHFWMTTNGTIEGFGRREVWGTGTICAPTGAWGVKLTSTPNTRGTNLAFPESTGECLEEKDYYVEMVFLYCLSKPWHAWENLPWVAKISLPFSKLTNQLKGHEDFRIWKLFQPPWPSFNHHMCTNVKKDSEKNVPSPQHHSPGKSS